MIVTVVRYKANLGIKKLLSFGRSLEILRGFFELGFFAEPLGVADYAVQRITHPDGVLSYYLYNKDYPYTLLLSDRITVVYGVNR